MNEQVNAITPPEVLESQEENKAKMFEELRKAAGTILSSGGGKGEGEGNIPPTVVCDSNGIPITGNILSKIDSALGGGINNLPF